MGDNRGKIIVGAVVTAVVVLVLILIVTKSSLNCDLSETKPLTGSLASHQYESSDRKSLVNFTGYLEYKNLPNKEAKKIYLPLELQSVSHDVKNAKSLVFNTNCATLTFNVTKADATNQVTSINVKLSTPNGDEKECNIGSTDIKFQEKNHYRCNIVKSYDCKSKTKNEAPVIATLLISALEFDLDGNIDDHKDHKYTGPPQDCPAS